MLQPYKPGRRSLPRWVGVLACLLLLAGRAAAQSFTLTGKVTDSKGEPLPGATVLVRGTGLGSAANAEGTYTITGNTKAGDYTLTASLVGYKTTTQTVALGPGVTASADFKLAESRQDLDEVVVVGSTVTQSRRELGNAISTVSAQQLQNTGSTQILNSLQGKIPGAQITQTSGDPAGAFTVRLRGIKSLSGSSDPLYVIDGVIVSNLATNVSQQAVSANVGGGTPTGQNTTSNTGQSRLADLNQNDIESINILNGAAAAAQYGSRAANGVVLITTKRGAAGAPRVSAYVSANMNELRYMVPVNTAPLQFGFAGLRLYTIAGVSAAQIAANPGTTTTGIFRQGTTTQLATNTVPVTRYNYFDQIFQRGYGTDNGVSISGGSDRTQYYVSLGYLKNQGIIRNTDFTRYNLRARIDQRFSSWARMSAGLSYANSLSNEKANGNVFYSPINSVNITNNIYDITQRDPSGNLLAVEPTRVNPLSTIEDMTFTQAVNRTVSNVQLNLTPVKGLSIDYVLGADAYGQFGQGYIRPYPYQAQAGLPAERYPTGFASNGNNNVLQLNSDLNIGYEKFFTQDLKLTLLGGYTFQYLRSEITAATGQGVPFPITTLSGASTQFTTAFDLAQYNVRGAYLQGTIGFKNQAFLTASLRRDASTLFSDSQTNQYYPKVSGSLVLSDFSFYQNAGLTRVFSTTKLRASYGESGGLTSINPYDRFYQFIPGQVAGRSAFLPSARLADANVRPERNAELEGGADFGFLQDRLGLSITGYYQRLTDLTITRSLAASSGGTSIVTNVGSMENRGLEVALNATPIRTSDFSWDFTAIFNLNRNRVTELRTVTGDAAIIQPLNSSVTAPTYFIQGLPAGIFYGTFFARRPDGSLLPSSQGLPQQEAATVAQSGGSLNFTPAPRDANGQIVYAGTTPALGIIGDPNPRWTGSFNTNFNYKKVGLHVLLDAVQGVSVFNADWRTRQGVGLGELAEQELRGTLQRGYIFASYLTDEFRMDNGSFVKLREVSLSFGLPTFSKLISNLNLALVGRNLYSWDKYKSFDPETSSGGASDQIRAVDFGNVPIPRTYQVRLSASF